MDRDELIKVLRAFEEQNLEYILIGATAMGFHGLVRATEDVDLLIKPTPENVERLRQALKATYADDSNIEDIRTEDLLGDYPAVRYYPANGDLFFDILTRLGDAAKYENVESEIKEVEGVRIRVATPNALYQLKKNTARPIDRQDAAALRERFNLGDE
ncbi:MAG: nucleotidyl transferase AbiEii/AbiGii toxin family protein [Acidobacteria bacterium]|nr:nucleotidyl transferase AbiEii/AbiGii toxin family protein [Acidobacteriota bacterium]